MGSNPAAARKNVDNFFSTFFFSFFITWIKLFIAWGMFTNHVDLLGGGEVLISSCKRKPSYSGFALKSKRGYIVVI